MFSVQDHEKTKTSSCTFLSVLVHFSVIITHLKDKVKPVNSSSPLKHTPLPPSPLSIKTISPCVLKAVHLRKALDVILQWCFNHNFSVRLYALLALKRVWSLVEEKADGLGGLSTVIKACLNQAEAMQSTG